VAIDVTTFEKISVVFSDMNVDVENNFYIVSSNINVDVWKVFMTFFQCQIRRLDAF